MDIQISNMTENLKRLGCTNEVFCVVAGISTARWSRAQRGIVVLPGDEVLRLHKVVRVLQEIQNAADLIPVDFRDADSVRRLFEHRTEGIVWKPQLFIADMVSGDTADE